MNANSKSKVPIIPGSVGARAQNRSVTFVVQRIANVWNITMDGAFYGKFKEERLALEAAQTGARGIIRRGGSVELVFAPTHRVDPSI
jgi:hypothetical protein